MVHGYTCTQSIISTFIRVERSKKEKGKRDGEKIILVPRVIRPAICGPALYLLGMNGPTLYIYFHCPAAGQLQPEE